MNEFVQYEQADGIATLTMDDGKANAFGLNMIKAMSGGLDKAVAEAKAVLITGRPGVLCAGFDLKVINGAPEDRQAMVRGGAELLLKLYLHPQPVIIACTGHAIAAGALLLLTADYRVGASGGIKIGLNETAIGLTLPTFGVELARDRLDGRYLTEAVIGARLYAPDEAAEVGFLDRAVATDDLTATAIAKAQEMQVLDATAFADVKQRLRHQVAATIRASFDSELSG